jgi:hypothetical protein
MFTQLHQFRTETPALINVQGSMSYWSAIEGTLSNARTPKSNDCLGVRS